MAEKDRPRAKQVKAAPDEPLAGLQDFLLDDPADLITQLYSVEQLEAIIARKRQAEAAHSSCSTTSVPLSALPSATAQPRFEPTRLVATGGKNSKGRSGGLWRNGLGYGLEALVIVGALVLIANWGLQQVGISLVWPGQTGLADFAVVGSRPEGIFLSANAAGAIRVPPTLTPVPSPTPAPTDAASRPTPGQAPTIAPLLAVAPTPTPAIVQPVRQSLAEGAAPPTPLPAPARRLVIPRLGVDTPVLEVTVNLGNWQVADNAAGHHVGTAWPGRVGNMVLAGHRDIRGSIFLRLNELQKGDDFRVITDSAVYRYVVTDIYEVAPSEVSVMSPSVDPTATLITCTPVGLATKRLIVKARLDK